MGPRLFCSHTTDANAGPYRNAPRHVTDVAVFLGARYATNVVCLRLHSGHVCVQPSACRSGRDDGMAAPTAIVSWDACMGYASIGSSSFDPSGHVNSVDTRPSARHGWRPLPFRRAAVLDFRRLVAAGGAHSSSPPRTMACAQSRQYGPTARCVGRLGATVESKAYFGQGHNRRYERCLFVRCDGGVPRNGRDFGRVQHGAWGTRHVATYQN